MSNVIQNGVPYTSALADDYTEALRTENARSNDIALFDEAEEQTALGQSFAIEQFGAVDTTGAASSYPALKAAWDAAIAAGGGRIILPMGTIYLNTASGQLRLPANFSGQLSIVGQGKYLTTVKLSNNNKSFIKCGTSQGAAYTYGNLLVSDLTVNDNNITPAFAHATIFSASTLCNLKNIAFVNVDTINQGGINYVDGTPGRAAVDMTISGMTAYDPTQYRVEGIRVRDCYWGRAGGGGNGGITIQEYISNGTQSTARSLVDRVANLYIDDVLIENTTWTSGETPTAFAFGVGFMIGGRGWGGRVRIRNCHAIGSPDDGFEINAMNDAVLEGCTATDCWNEGYYYRPMGRHDDPNQARIVLRDCTYFRKAMVGSGYGIGFILHGSGGLALGNVLMDRCSTIRNGGSGLGGHIGIRGVAAGDITIRDSVFTANGVTSAYTTNSQTFLLHGISVQIWGKTKLTIDGHSHTWNNCVLDSTGFTGAIAHFGPLLLDTLTDVQLDVKGVRSSFDYSTPASVNDKFANIRFNHGAVTSNLSENFASAGVLDSYFLTDAGANSDLSVTGGVATSVANHGTEKRFRYIESATSSFLNQGIGPVTDSAVWMKFNYAQVSGHKGGVTSKVLDASNYVEAYLTDDGTNSVLNIDKISAGSRTNLATATLGARVADNTPYWVRLVCRKNTLTADYYTSAPASTSAGGTGANTVTATLTGTDALKFGESVNAHVGWVFVPGSSVAYADSINLVRLSVYGGSVRNMAAKIPSGIVNEAYGLSWGVSNSLARVRKLIVESNDWRGIVGATTVADTDGLIGTTGFGDSVTMRNNAITSTAPAAASVTYPGSGTAYVNTDGYVQQITWYGGTITVVEVSLDGGTTWTQVRAAGDGQLILQPGEQIRWTSSVSPTVRKVPMR